jgi:hypothetical protein
VKLLRRLLLLGALAWAAGAYRRYRLERAPAPSWD